MMLSLSDASRYFLYRHPADMRKVFTASRYRHRTNEWQSFEWRHFYFSKPQPNQVKLLRWEKDGFAIYTKRLEQGTYDFQKDVDENAFLISQRIAKSGAYGILLCDE